MGLESFFLAKAKGMESDHRPPAHQQVMQEALYEDGYAKEAAVHRQAQRPIRLLRSEGRLLRPINSSEGPRGVHSKSRRTFVTTLRSTYEVEPVPLYLSEI